MKIFNINHTLLLFLFFLFISCNAQDPGLTKNYKDKTIETVNSLLVDYYVFPEVAIKTKNYLNKLNEKGYFEKYRVLDSFALALSKRIYDITKDRHISVDKRSASDRSNIEKDVMTRWINERMEEREFFRKYNANFKEVKKLDGNIGYLDLRGFYGIDYGRETADHVMSLLAKSDAIIIDLRNNSGGRGSMSDYLVSYFFKEPIITSKTTKRVGDSFEEKIHLSAKQLNGRRMPKVPLFLLTSSKTFSAAEGFTYALKVYERATLIGEKTKGGANPGDLIPLNNELQIFIPDIAVTHPLTKDSWEGSGITPDIEINSEKALDTALVLARKFAKSYKLDHDEKAKELLRNLNKTISNYEINQKGTPILDAYLLCRKNDLIFEEWEINSLASEKYQQGQKETAKAILAANTIIYYESPYTFNNYAQVLLKEGNKEKAIINYKRAVEIAEITGHPDLKIFQENLKKSKT